MRNPREVTDRVRKSPGVRAWIENLERRGMDKRPFSRAGQIARSWGLTEDIWELPDGEQNRWGTQEDVRKKFGDEWYKVAKATGHESLTPFGHMVLSRLRQEANPG
jgi:hypothetical protein